MFNTIKKFFGYISLSSFAISDARKFRFAMATLMLAGLVYFEATILAITEMPRFIQLLTVLLSSHLILSLVRFFLATAHRQHNKLAVGEHDNFLIGIDALVLLFTIMITLGSIFPIYDVPFTDFVMSLSVFSVAIVWGFHQYITNFLDGLRLMFSSDFRLGDYIRIDDKSKGIITDINFRATRLRTDEGNVVFVPNTTILNSEVTNFSKLKYKRIVICFTISHRDAAGMAEFETALREKVAEQFSKTIKPEKTYFRILSIKKDEIDCCFEIATDHYSFDIEDQITKKVNQAVLALA